MNIDLHNIPLAQGTVRSTEPQILVCAVVYTADMYMDIKHSAKPDQKLVAAVLVQLNIVSRTREAFKILKSGP